MPDTPPLPLQAAVARMWTGCFSDESEATSAPAFRALIEQCIELYCRPSSKHEIRSDQDRSFLESAVRNAFRATGAPWYKGQISPSAESVAWAIHSAFMDSTSEVIHLCPLDEADKLPALTFDRCELCRPTEQYLADLVQPMRLLNHSSRWIFDTKTFAQFTWIVVRENRPLGSVGNRLMPMLYINVDDIDLVETHPSGLPTVVEHALFAVLLFPWEDVVRHANFQWQPFRIPWVYTIDKDPFAFPKPPPSPNALSWEPHIFKDGSEGEHPSVWDLDRDGLVRLPEAMHDLWAMASRVCPLRADSNGPFNPLIRHFTVKAFRERGIDELIAHIMAIEAALALQTDTNRRKDKRTATEKLCYRIRTLLGSENASEEFKTFYELRSDFVHGRLLRCKLRTKQLHVLRQIVRRVLLRMIEQIDQKGWSDRTEFLDHLSSPEGGNPRSS